MRRLLCLFLLTACHATTPPREIAPSAVHATPIAESPEEASPMKRAETNTEAKVRRLTQSLEATTKVAVAVPIMRDLEAIFGLPAFYEPHAMQCGEPGPDVEAFRREHIEREEKAFVDGRRELLAWVHANALLPRDKRIHAAFAAWDAHHWIAEPDHWPAGVGTRTVQRYATVIALGPAALPELSARRHAAKTEREIALFQILTAAISGTYDEAVVAQLDEELREEVIAAAKR